VQEKKLLQTYFDEISVDSGKYCFMVADTLQALDMSCVHTIIVWENLAVNRLTRKNTVTGAESIVHLTPEQEANDSHFHEKDTGVQLEIANRITLVEWLAENYKSFGAALEFITDRSQEGSQFCRGFGGIGGLLRWKVDFQEMEVQEYVGDDFDDEFI
jgi:peptide chain release factor subunit 1